MKKQYIQPNIVENQMVCIQSDISILTASKGINVSPGSPGEYKTTFAEGNSNIEIGTKERNDWGKLGDDQVSYGNIW